MDGLPDDGDPDQHPYPCANCGHGRNGPHVAQRILKIPVVPGLACPCPCQVQLLQAMHGPDAQVRVAQDGFQGAWLLPIEGGEQIPGDSQFVLDRDGESLRLAAAW